MTQCKAMSKSTHKQCKKEAEPGREVCRFHGGLTPRGPASPHWKTGKYSKFLPARLANRYTESMNDPDLLSLREEIALTDARMAELLSRLDTGESGATWKDMRATVARMKQATSEGDTSGFIGALETLEILAARGASDYEVWGGISAILETRRKLVDGERKRLVDMQNNLNIQQAMTFASQLLEIVRKNVTDRKQLSGIVQDMERLLYAGEKQPVSIER